MKKLQHDRRALRTKRNLMKAYNDLLLEKSVEEIDERVTVREVCEAADVNRSTFYLHFESVDDLFEKMKVEVFTELYRLLGNRKFENLQGRAQEVITETVKVLDRNAGICLMLFRKSGSITGNPPIEKIVSHKIRHEWYPGITVCDLETGGTSDSRTWYNAWFIIYGMLGAFAIWITTGKRETAEELSEILFDFICKG